VKISVTDNPSELRYELHVDGSSPARSATAADPTRSSSSTPTSSRDHEGHGLGSRLVRGALDDLRARGLALVPLCPFVADYIGRHPEYADLVTTDRP
jgi:uncharacterized protein